MKKKHETLVLPGLFYCFVDMERASPDAYIVPCEVVADVVKKSHAAWLSTPGKGGQPHNDNDMRRVIPAYKYKVDGYKDDWLQRYWDDWSILSGAQEPK